MIVIDGSQGEGGGQILRSSLALALVTGIPVTVEHIRAGRKKPGLLRQHLAAVRAAADVSQAEVDGAELGSRRLVFRPGPVRSGSYNIRIGSAGSTTLVFQTIYPALMLAEAPSQLFLEGGTHNPLAPPFDFLQQTLVPCLAKMGPSFELHLERYGFFPAGGGRFRASIEPASTLKPLELIEGRPLGEPSVHALVARLPESIGWRECRTIIRSMGWPEECACVQTIRDSAGPGNVVLVRQPAGDVVELFTGFGRRGVRAEHVAEEVVKALRRFLEAQVPVGEYLADQLLLPMALAAARDAGTSRIVTLPLTRHSTTQLDLIPRFLDVRFAIRELGGSRVCVEVR